MRCKLVTPVCALQLCFMLHVGVLSLVWFRKKGEEDSIRPFITRVISLRGENGLKLCFKPSE